MKLSSTYTSDISKLISLANKNTIFLSSWDKDKDILPFPISKIDEYNTLFSNEINKYFFSDELKHLKEAIFIENIDFKRSHILSNNFTFVSNGTTAALLCILTILKEKQFLRVLLLSPIYYIYVDILKILGADIFVESGYCLNYNKIDTEIKSHKINLVIINNPLFGTGLCIPREMLAKIQISLSENSGCLLIDNIYNGLKWNEDITLNDFKLYESLSVSDNYIILESLAKNLYLNGIKHCILFSTNNWITKLENNSVFLCGSITAQQVKFIQKLYSKKEHQFVLSQLSKSVEYAKNNYDFLISLLSKSNFWLGECQSGTYCLLGIPNNQFAKQDYTSNAIEILKKANILTLPHDRYLFTKSNYYCFRINLMTDKNVLFEAIKNLQKCFDA